MAAASPTPLLVEQEQSRGMLVAPSLCLITPEDPDDLITRPVIPIVNEQLDDSTSGDGQCDVSVSCESSEFERSASSEQQRSDEASGGQRRRRAANPPPPPSAELPTPAESLNVTKTGSALRRSLLDLPHQFGAQLANLMPRPMLTRSHSDGSGPFRVRNARSHTDLRSAFTIQSNKPMRMPSVYVALSSRRSEHTQRPPANGAGHRRNTSSRSTMKSLPNNDDPSNVERDQYGFRKGNAHLSLEDIHRFETTYAATAKRRQEKWDALLRECTNGQLPPLSSKVKRFIRKGIPANIRGQCWLHYSGAAEMMKRNQGRYHQLVALSSDRKYREYRDLIERDLHRTFPENIRFTSAGTKASHSSNTSVASSVSSAQSQHGAGVGREGRTTTPVTSRFRQQPASSNVPILQRLRRVLTAFAVRCPSVGYCQSLNYVAGLMLLFMSEEETFWMLCTVVERIMPEGMYGVKMEGVTVDQEVLMRLLEDRIPAIHNRLSRDEGEIGAPPITFVTSHWFLTLFVDVLPVESNLRVWDCLFLEGSEVLFRVALTLFKMHEQQICAIDDPLELFQYLQNMPKRLVDCHILMENCFRKYTSLTHINSRDLERRRKTARDRTILRVSTAPGVVEAIPKRVASRAGPSKA